MYAGDSHSHSKVKSKSKQVQQVNTASFGKNLANADDIVHSSG